MIELSMRRFQGRGDGPRLLITGGVHGDEFEPMRAIRALIADLDARRFCLEKGQLVLIPCVNEGAFLRGDRVADDGLDLARVCPGKRDGSPTEQVAAALSEQIAAADYYIDLHTGGTELSVQPMTGYTLHTDRRVLAEQRQMADAFNLPVIWGTCGTLDGRSLSVARDHCVPAIYAEFLGGARCSDIGVFAYVQGCMNVLHYLEMYEGPPSMRQTKLIVEDPRDGSGHMQVCNPSPIDGDFQPLVSLGAEVHRGETIGYVTDVLGEQVIEIHAAFDGRVHVLRTFPRVRQGESVGVILGTSAEYVKTEADWS